MFGEAGAAQKLLYQIMVAVRGFERNVLGNDPAVRLSPQSRLYCALANS